MTRRLLTTYHAWWLTTMLLSVTVSSMATAVQAKKIDIGGWRTLELRGTQPAAELGDDPVVGRLVCPPISRLDLEKQRIDHLLISQVDAKDTRWTYTLRSGLYWWHGDEVTAKDLADFLRRELPRLAKGLGVPARAPKFRVTAKDMDVTVKWDSKPDFGPYLVNGASLWRPKQDRKEIQYECVGLYHPVVNDQGFELQPTVGYKTKRAPMQLMAKADPDKYALSFMKAAQFSSNPWTRLSDKKLSCDKSIEVPVFTALVWNGNVEPTRDPEFRKILTELTPRGALVRSGAGYLGTLVSGPIPKAHPGYNKDVKVRDFDLVDAGRALDKLGFQRKASHSPRLDRDGKPMVLRIQPTSKEDGLLEKVLADAFASVGIQIEYVREKPAYPHVHGVLASLRVDWPQVDLLPHFFGSNAAAFPLFAIEDTELEKHLRQYSRSLTYKNADFAALRAAHKRWYELEPMTILLQHKVCLNTRDPWQQRAKRIDVRDPDWFRTLVR